MIFLKKLNVNLMLSKIINKQRNLAREREIKITEQFSLVFVFDTNLPSHYFVSVDTIKSKSLTGIEVCLLLRYSIILKKYNHFTSSSQSRY